MELQNRYRGCLLGLAVGDALGTSVEFKAKGSFTPVTDMRGGGVFNLKPGQWTDDTSMALCLAESLIEFGFDPKDQMDRYIRWWKNGENSSTGECFDIGNTVLESLNRYLATQDPFSGSVHPHSAGNGSLMRLASVPLVCYPDVEKTLLWAGDSSRTTHALPECIDACRYYAYLINLALSGLAKHEMMEKAQCIPTTSSISLIARADWREWSVEEVVGSGYVVESLRASLWSFLSADSFEEAVLKATNLGDDADTTAAITGQLAGAYYGYYRIPSQWLERLCQRDRLLVVADQLLAVAQKRSGLN
jgi:ADP-ribosyl-[dinitrogen reductase] hydrolase